MRDIKTDKGATFFQKLKLKRLGWEGDWEALTYDDAKDLIEIRKFEIRKLREFKK